MSTVLKDGTGTGNNAKIDGDNNLRTATVNIQKIASVSDRENKAFIFNMPHRTTTTTNGLMMYIKNTSSTDHFHLSQAFTGWNGGTSSGTKSMKVNVYVGTYPPSANNTEVEAGNLRIGSAISAEVDFEIWDEVSTGMTTAVPGLLAASFTANKGMTIVQIQGSMIVPPNMSMGIYMDCEEVGEASFMISGHFEIEGHD